MPTLHLASISAFHCYDTIGRCVTWSAPQVPAYNLLSVLPATVTVIKHSFGSQYPWVSYFVLSVFSSEL